MSPEQAWVWLARIRKAQGRKGEVFADLLTDFPDKFKDRTEVWLLKIADEAADFAAPDVLREAREAREAKVTGFFLHKGGLVLRFAGVESIPEADALRGWVVAIPRAERVALPDDEVYVGDLIGCLLVDVFSGSAKAIGVIESVDRAAGPVALLVVRPAGSRRADDDAILVPFAKAYLHKVDLEGRRVEMRLPEGLVEIQVGEQR